MSYSQRRWILDLEPSFGPAGAVCRAQPLRHHALAAKLAGLLIEDFAVADVMLVECDTSRRLAQQLGNPGFAHLDRQPAQILAIKLERSRCGTLPFRIACVYAMCARTAANCFFATHTASFDCVRLAPHATYDASRNNLANTNCINPVGDIPRCCRTNPARHVRTPIWLTSQR